MNHYILDKDHNLISVSLMEWAVWFEKADRHVNETMIADMRVSTVFLGLDHGYNSSRPVLFETLVFGENNDTCGMQRCCTWDEAVKQHEKTVEKLKKKLECDTKRS